MTDRQRGDTRAGAPGTVKGVAAPVGQSARSALATLRTRVGRLHHRRRPGRIPLAGMPVASDLRDSSELTGGPPAAIIQRPPSRLEFRLELPPFTRFEAWVISPAEGDGAPGPLEFTLRRVDDRGAQTLWSRELAPEAGRDAVATARAWLTGRRRATVSLVLETAAVGADDRPSCRGSWVEPVLIVGGVPAARVPLPSATGRPPGPRRARAGRAGRLRSRGERREPSAAPLVSVLMPVHDPGPLYLDRALRSLAEQTHRDWELCLVEDGSQGTAVRRLIDHYAEDPRVRTERLEGAQGISAATNRALGMASGRFVALLDHDDELEPDALEAVAAAVSERPDADMFYTDEVWTHADGTPFQTVLKPAWSPELFAATMYSCHLGVYRRSLVDEIGGLRSEFDGSQDYDLVLRLSERSDRIVHVPGAYYCWRHHRDSTAARSRGNALDAARRALADHYERIGAPSTVEMPRHEGIYRRRQSASSPATTTIVIAIAAGDVPRLSQLIESGRRLLATADGGTSLIFVAAGSDLAERCRAALAATDASESVIAGSPRASRAALFDLAASHASSDQLVFVSKPCEPLSDDWLEALAGQCASAGVGAAGARVQSPHGRVEDCGVVVSQGLPLHAELGEEVSNWRRTCGVGLVAPRNWSAASGVLMVRREVLRRARGFAAGGFDQLADVDLCLRLRRLGLRNVVTPFADLRRLAVDDQEVPAVDVGELVRFQHRWWSTAVDPYYHPGLPADRAEFLPAPERRTPLPRWRAPIAAGADPAPPVAGPETVRGSLAWRYLRGDGIEIGALHKPLEVPPRAHPRYVDRLPATLLRAHYPELDGEWLVEPDILDEAERLEQVGDGSRDFVIANHLLEHVEDPIGAIQTWLRVLRPGGILFMAVPDKRFTFDSERSTTTLEHLIRDHVEGPAGSRREHLEDWARCVARVPEGEVATKAAALAEAEYSIHNHVWTQSALIELLLYCRERLDPFEIEALQRNENEVVVVVRKTANTSGSADGAPD